MNSVTIWALIRTICAIIAAVVGVGTFVGSVIYWTSWKRRSKKLREELKEDKCQCKDK